MSYETLSVRREGAVLYCTLNRPAALNTLNLKLVDEYNALLDELASDVATRVVVLRGAGKAFCAGLDLKETGFAGDGSVSAGMRSQRHISQIAIKMRKLPQVFLACVHGAACGGGFMLALASDIRIAGESARMNAAFIKLGLSGCDVGVSYLLPRLIGASVASELILTGRFLEAERARELGLVAAVVPDDKLDEEAARWLADLLRTTPLGLRLSKETLNASLEMSSLEAVIAMEDRNQVLSARTEDFREGVLAFVQKREPSFKNR